MEHESPREDEFHDAVEEIEDLTNTETSDQLKYGVISKAWELELWKIAGEIDPKDTRSVGVILGFPFSKMSHLEGIYPSEPQNRNYVLLQKWCQIIESKYGNSRRFLAKYLVQANYKNIADNMKEDINDIQTPSQLLTDLQDVSFDIPKRTEIQRQLSVVYQRIQVNNYVQSDKRLIASLNRSTDKPEIVYSAKQNGYTESRKTCMLSILRDLGLEEFYPAKISLTMVTEIEKPTDEDVRGKSTPEQFNRNLKRIPWRLLRKLMGLNYKGRDEDLNVLYECSQDANTDDFADETPTSTVGQFHSLDVFLLTFLCCDPILKQELLSKMFVCRIAVPFIYRTLDDKLIMTKWAFRKIVINRKKGEKWIEDDALSQFVKTVSCIRIGPQTFSKSKMINEILSDQKHSTFFNCKDCSSFKTDRLISEGIVEASWFIPSNRSDENAANTFEDVVMFLNLRGDCRQHIEELDSVSLVSDVIIVYLDINILNELEIVKLLKKIHHSEKFIIYALECIGANSNHQVKYFKQQFEFKEEKTTFLKVDSESSLTIVKKFRRNISEYLMNMKATKFSEGISCIKFSDDSFSVDGYTMAKDIKDFIDKEQVKHEGNLLPLQGPLWTTFCQLTKELYRSKSEDDQAKLKKQIKIVKQDQSKLVTKSHILQKFTEKLFAISNKKESRQESLFFIAWIKSFIDERLRGVRPDFDLKYKELRLLLKVANEKGNRSDIDKLSRNILEINRLFNSNALCLEHFIREMGQLFQIQKYSPAANDKKRNYDKFPSFVSKMLQYGFPFEIMDGDTGMVPMVWVNAVLGQLREDIGEQNIYAISVLGIQSSGKSTLLNTMFGLDFAVSAGRCTRGVFMQLIKVSNPELKFEYLLILDTEGIRASVYETNRRVFENELATFAIGLGNITILNIKGENTSEIEDFLQIAVHACLRLKMANKDLKIHQTCVFVHQNVCANDANIKLRDQRETLMHRLDKMVKDAALHEDRSDLYSFNQIIGIDIEKDIWYFPDLWQGEPPMATVTLGYSTQVSRLKNHILYNIAQPQRLSYSITDTMIRIHDIWRGILMDDFVFSFRNGLEIKPYREIELFFQQLTWKPECDIEEFISTTVSEKMARCSNDDDLASVCDKYFSELSKKLRDIFSLKQDEWNDFVNNSRFKQSMEQYTESKTIQLEEWGDMLLKKGINDIHRRKNRHTASLLQISEMKQHKNELKNKAQDLVTKCKTDELADQDLVKHFDAMWGKWIDGIKSSKERKSLSIETVIENKMFELFKAYKPFLQKEMEAVKNSRDTYCKLTELANTIKPENILDDHITVSSSMGVRHSVESNQKMKYKRMACGTINIIMKKIDTYISSLQTEYLLFKESYATRVFMILVESLTTNNSNINNSFSMTASLRAHLAVHIKMYIVEVFAALNDEWEDKNDIKKQMQSEKQTYLDNFIALVKDKAAEVRMANLFLHEIEAFIEITVLNKLPSDVVNMIIPDSFSTKYSLMIEIMRDLVRQSDFNEFMRYIDDCNLYALDWLTTYMNEKLFKQIKSDTKNNYSQIVKKHINVIISKIRQSIIYATEQMAVNEKCDIKKQHISVWSTLFEDNLGWSLAVTKGTFLTNSDDEILDFCNYKRLITERLNELSQIIYNRFKKHNAQNVKWSDSPYKQVFNELWGCTEQCPFCKESCQKRANHKYEKHSCIQHRPPAVWGVRDERSQIMTWMSCNCLVFSMKSFYCSASNWKCHSKENTDSVTTHPYREYSTLIPDWIIEPSPLHELPEYWIWFISKYQKQLCELYDYKVHEDIDEWSKLSENDAVSSLTRYSRSSHE